VPGAEVRGDEVEVEVALQRVAVSAAGGEVARGVGIAGDHASLEPRPRGDVDDGQLHAVGVEVGEAIHAGVAVALENQRGDAGVAAVSIG